MKSIAELGARDEMFVVPGKEGSVRESVFLQMVYFLKARARYVKRLVAFNEFCRPR